VPQIYNPVPTVAQRSRHRPTPTAADSNLVSAVAAPT
jgi:hypothetical protein